MNVTIVTNYKGNGPSLTPSVVLWLLKFFIIDFIHSGLWACLCFKKRGKKEKKKKIELLLILFKFIL